MSDERIKTARTEAMLRAQAEVVDWDEYGGGYGPGAELVVCWCGAPYPMRGEHRCAYTMGPGDPEYDAAMAEAENA